VRSASGNRFGSRISTHGGERSASAIRKQCAETSGLAIFYKRLEKNEFRFPKANTVATEISREQLLQLLSGCAIELKRSA
jgi:hypothetical protein